MSTDDDRLRLLSDAERAAMQDDDYNPEEENAAALAALGGGAQAEDEPAAKAQPEAHVASESASDADANAVPEPVAAQEPPQEHPQPQAYGYHVQLPGDFDERLKSNKAAQADLRKRLNDGEIDAQEYGNQVEVLQDEREELARIKTRAEIATEMREQQQANDWQNTINSFVSDTAAVLDYRKDAAKQADLDMFVRTLAQAQANEGRPMRWFLDEAHKRVLALHGLQPVVAAPVSAAQPPQAPRRFADSSKVVTGLADVPGGAGDASPADDAFADIDKLSGLDYERALAKLSSEQRAQYLMAT